MPFKIGLNLFAQWLAKGKFSGPEIAAQTIFNRFVLFRTATEIRCQEKSRGGLCYEVILAEPSPNTAQPVVAMRNKDAQNKGLSAAEIEKKLKEAEQRRLVREIYELIDKVVQLQRSDNKTKQSK